MVLEDEEYHARSFCLIDMRREPSAHVCTASLGMSRVCHAVSAAFVQHGLFMLSGQRYLCYIHADAEEARPLSEKQIPSVRECL